MRNVFAVLLGTMVAFGLVSVGDAMAGSMLALPTGIDPTNRPAVTAALEAALAKAPLRAMLTMVAGYFVAAFGGGFVARKIASTKTLWPSITVALLVLAATMANFAMIKHPLMMVVLGGLAPIPGAMLGARTAGGGTAAATAGVTAD
jgi:hypothetical protein